jgi:hypothetical protein
MKRSMTTQLRMLILMGVSAIAAAPAALHSQDFQWRGTLAEGRTLEIRGVNGTVRAVASDDGSAHVQATKHARRSDPASVRIETVEHDGGVTLCVVYPTPPRAQRANDCRPGGGQNNVQNNDVRVDFVVRVPAGVHFAGSTVNGDVDARGLRSDVTAATVNGQINVQTSGFVSRAATVNGNIVLQVPAGLNADVHASTVNGTIDTDFPLAVSGRIGPRSLRGTVGSGGRELRTSTVNGNIRLRQF